MQRLRLGKEKKNKKIEETTGQKYNGHNQYAWVQINKVNADLR